MNRHILRLVLRAEAAPTAAYALIGALVGVLFESLWIGLTAGLLCLLVSHVSQAVALLQWQQSPKSIELPEGSGIWTLIYDGALARYRQARKRKKRLGEILAEFRASTAALPDAAVVLDPQGRITWFNQAAHRLLALQSPRDQGQRIANLLRHPAFLNYLRSEDGAAEGVEIPHPTEPESVLWVRLIPYGRKQNLLIARDVTDRLRMEQMRRDFVSNASHELRTPLTVISGYLELIRAEAEAASDKEPLAVWSGPLQEMQRQSQRMEQIIGDMLRLARLEGAARLSERQPIHMPRLLADAIKVAQTLSEGRHQIHAEIDDSVKLDGQPSEIQSVVGNLLSNAVRYTPDGGDITLRWYRQAEQRVLEVQDTGIGVSARDLPRLTERFYRADIARSRETGGTGLGLAIVKHALERHGARLEIRSKPGLGSCFRCVFSPGGIDAVHSV